MSDPLSPTESPSVEKKIASSTDHAKKALDAAADATRVVGETVKTQAKSAFDASKEHISAAARDLGDAASVKIEDLRSQAKAKADEVRDKANTAWGDASARAQTYQSETESYVRENPLKAIGIAVGIGFVLGVIFRR